MATNPAAYEALTTSEVLHWQPEVRLAWLRRIAQALDRTERALARQRPDLSRRSVGALAERTVEALVDGWNA